MFARQGISFITSLAAFCPNAAFAQAEPTDGSEVQGETTADSSKEDVSKDRSLARIAPVGPLGLGGSNLSGPGIGGKKGEDPDDTQFRIVPVPVVNPTFGSGLALAGILTFGSEQHRSTAALGAAFTKKGTWLAGVGGSLHFADDRYRVAWGGAVGELKLKYYGVGPESFFADNPVDFSGLGWAAQIQPEIQVADSVFVGVLGRYMDATIETALPIDILPELKVPFKIVSLGPVVEHDTRDIAGWPTRGVHAKAQYIFSKDTLNLFGLTNLSGHFDTFDLSASTYLGLRDDLVLALKGRGAGSSDNTPFFLKPSISFRGYSSGERLDDYVVEGEAEMRWMFNNKFGVVAFAGVGSTGQSFGSLSGVAMAAGFGGRYRFSQIDRSSIGFDIAHSNRGNWSIYFSIGESF